MRTNDTCVSYICTHVRRLLHDHRMDQRLQCCIVDCNARVVWYAVAGNMTYGAAQACMFGGAGAYGTAKVMKEGAK